MLSEKLIGFLGLFGGVFILALLLGNFILLSFSLVPLFLILLGLLLKPPKTINVKTGEIKKPIWAGDVIEISHEVVIGDGVGVVLLHQKLPAEFELVRGNNFKIFWKEAGEKSFIWSYSVRCPKRGKYVLPKVNWESRHILGLLQTSFGSSGSAIEMIVRPKILNIRRIRGIPGIALSPYPVIDIARIGVPTTDFREIRNYRQGDPIRAINWKVTARQAGRGVFWPLVNDFEVEGKKAVWIFLDAAAYMEVGTTVENAFEYALEAANGVAFYYLERGYRVGVYVYHDERKLCYPDSGRKQFNRLSQELIELKTSPTGDEFPQAIDRCRGYILGLRPLCIIISRLDGPLAKSLLDGVKKLAKFRGRSRRRFPVMVISIPGYEVLPKSTRYERYAALLSRLETRPLVHALQRLGAAVLEWNPRRESFATALLRQTRTR